MRSVRALSALALSALLFAACSKNSSGSSSSGSGGTGSTGATTAGSSGGTSGSNGGGDAGPKACTADAACTAPQVCDTAKGFCVDPCQYDDECGAGTRCDTPTGKCVAATACDSSLASNPCASDEADDYCYKVGGRCTCSTASGQPGPGFCKRVRTLCSACASDSQCNPCPGGAADCDPSNFVYPSACKPVSDAGSYCLRLSSGAAPCPRGYLADPLTGACQPQTKSCTGNTACASDTECTALLGSGHVCDLSSGICKEVCGFDYVTGTSTNCPPSKVCHVLPQFVLPDAGIVLYGVGQCGAPCDTPTGPNCQSLGQASGLTFTCATEKSGEKRCRPVKSIPAGATPNCMADIECPRTTDGGPYAGYCKGYEFACGYDCREGVNPLNGKLYEENDCAPPPGSDTTFKCLNHQCLEKNCVEQGGAVYGRAGELCCGQARGGTAITPSGFSDTSLPVNACAPGVDAGNFFRAPAPPWCKPSCDGSDLEKSIATCNGPDSGLPSFDKSPNICMQYAQGKFACALAATKSDVCPKNWNFGAPFQVGCDNDSDCLPSDGGRAGDGGSMCVKTFFSDGGLRSAACGCSQEERLGDGGYFWGGQCPDVGRCYQRRSCVFTVGCQPSDVACRAVNP